MSTLPFVVITSKEKRKNLFNSLFSLEEHNFSRSLTRLNPFAISPLPNSKLAFEIQSDSCFLKRLQIVLLLLKENNESGFAHYSEELGLQEFAVISLTYR